MASPRDLRLLAYYVEIVRAGSIRSAAARLSLSPAVVSEALSDLEDIMGVTLVRRTTRSMQVTAEGDALFQHAALVVSAGDKAMASARKDGGAPKGVVSLTLPTELSVAWLPPILRAFETAYPEIRLEVHADDDIVSLPSSGFDLAIRTSFSPRPSSDKDVCACLPLEVVCAPSLLEQSGSVVEETVEQRLKRIGIIGQASGSRNHRIIEAFPRAESLGSSPKNPSPVTLKISAPRKFVVNNQLVAHRLALEGFGCALLMRNNVATDLQEGRLARIHPAYSFGYVICRAIARDRYPSRPTQAFLDFLAL